MAAWSHVDDEEEAMADGSSAGDDESGLVAVIQLLRAAADGAWARAQTEGAWSVWHARALGAYVAACHGASLMGADVQDPQFTPEPEMIDSEPVALVRAAEAGCRAVGIEAWPAGAGALVVAVGDLVREWTHRGD